MYVCTYASSGKKVNSIWTTSDQHRRIHIITCSLNINACPLIDDSTASTFLCMPRQRRDCRRECFADQPTIIRRLCAAYTVAMRWLFTDNLLPLFFSFAIDNEISMEWHRTTFNLLFLSFFFSIRIFSTQYIYKTYSFS